jgi:hypothetical protein
MKHRSAALFVVLSSLAFAANAPQYQSVSLADLKVDIQDMKGKKVQTKGEIQVMGSLDGVMLKTDPMDMAPIWLNANKLPRDDKKKLLNGCQVVTCTATVSGTIGQGAFGAALVAESVVWK